MTLRAARLLGLLLLAGGIAEATDSKPRRFVGSVRGITVSTHTDGRDWARDAMVDTLKQIREVGADWIAIHPYAGIAADGQLRHQPRDASGPPPHVVRPITEAHALGLKVLVKPHLAYWGSGFGWRGEIRFNEPEAWRRFWHGYERWIVGLARAASNADGFVVGTELDLTLDHERAWRHVIAAVRRETNAPLTYAANWTDFDRVPFWDDLDAIGIQAYFPLVEQGHTDAGSIRAGWRDVMSRLRRFADVHDRPIVFTELGYNRSFSAPVRPWDARSDGNEARGVQESCMREALRAIEQEPAVIGAFLWKWFPLPRPVGRNFQLATPGMKSVIREAWTDRRQPIPEISGSSRFPSPR